MQHTQASIDTHPPRAYIANEVRCGGYKGFPAAFAAYRAMAKSSFGEHLKREREMRGVSLQEISTATRISTRFLDALETEQWDRLPGGVFNRGFVRAVAHFLGLDEESLLA